MNVTISGKHPITRELIGYVATDQCVVPFIGCEAEFRADLTESGTRTGSIVARGVVESVTFDYTTGNVRIWIAVVSVRTIEQVKVLVE